MLPALGGSLGLKQNLSNGRRVGRKISKLSLSR